MVRWELVDGAWHDQWCCGMAWNIDRAEDVKAIHDAYRAAGSQLITTNSFGVRASCSITTAAPMMCALSISPPPSRSRRCREDAWVLGDVGPCGISSNPSAISRRRGARGFLRSNQSFVRSGADAILVETMSDPRRWCSD